MLGCVLGELAGSNRFLYDRKTYSYEPLIDWGNYLGIAAVQTLVTASVLLDDVPYRKALSYFSQEIGLRTPLWKRPVETNFLRWVADVHSAKLFSSPSQGAARGISPVAYFCKDIDDLLSTSERIARLSHNHSQAVRGAQATALAIFLARHGASAKSLVSEIKSRTGYEIVEVTDAVRFEYRTSQLARVVVPLAISCAVFGESFEDSLRRAVSIDGSSGDIAAITGAIAEARFGIPETIHAEFLHFPFSRAMLPTLNRLYCKQ